MSVAEQVDTHIVFESPPLWNVIFFNDDITPMEFVIYLLTSVFSKEAGDAFELMLAVHETGSAAVYQSTHEVVKTKVEQCNEEIKKFGFPLKITYQEN